MERLDLDADGNVSSRDYPIPTNAPPPGLAGACAVLGEPLHADNPLVDRRYHPGVDLELKENNSFIFIPQN
jgi:hypothetical protein